MACIFDHDWGWPRRRGDKDVQVCARCGTERESRVRFDGPRYHRTQDPLPVYAAGKERSPRVAAIRGPETLVA